MKSLSAFAVAAVLFAPIAASATTINVSIFDASAYGGLLSSGTFVGEDFEALGIANGAGEVGPTLSTAVGTFSSVGGTGTGGTVTGQAGNTGTQLALRTGDVFGRTNQVPTNGRWYLDSNDTFGMVWNVAVGAAFDTVAFALSDASDQGGYLRIVADGVTREVRTGAALANSNDRLVVISFDTAVTAATVSLVNYTAFGGGTMRANDGFSVDGMQVRLSPVPLPAAGLLLIAGLGALGVMRSRRTA